MKLFNKNILKDILYIAEIGVNHEGNINRCKKLIREAVGPLAQMRWRPRPTAPL